MTVPLGSSYVRRLLEPCCGLCLCLCCCWPWLKNAFWKNCACCLVRASRAACCLSLAYKNITHECFEYLDHKCNWWFRNIRQPWNACNLKIDNRGITTGFLIADCHLVDHDELLTLEQLSNSRSLIWIPKRYPLNLKLIIAPSYVEDHQDYGCIKLKISMCMQQAQLAYH